MTTTTELEGLRYLVTGANTGIGRVTALELARRGGHVTLACRSAERAQPVIDEIAAACGADRATFLQLDLGSFETVRRSAQTFLDGGQPLDVLVNNAGLAGLRGTTADGFEMAFGVNHLGPFLFTLLLLPRLREAKAARIVNVASNAHYAPSGIDFDAARKPTRTRTGKDEYNMSKLGNVLFSAELARQLQGSGIDVYSLHPGVVASDVWRKIPWPVRPLIKLFMISNEEGALTTLHCATSPALRGESGLYYDKCAPRTASAPARDEALAAKLWAESLRWTGAPDVEPGPAANG
jgi:retinol dehydrogenase 12